MLAPVSYERDVTRIIGNCRLNHKPIDTQTLNDCRLATKPIWNQKYPLEPFDPHIDVTKNDDFESSFDYDIAAGVQRQKVFFYQVSLPHYRSTSFLKTSVQRYKMYLHLKSLYPDEFLVPCYDMDLCWHTHQIQPILYRKETKKILGEILPHDDSVNDRTPGSKLTSSEDTTRKL